IARSRHPEAGRELFGDGGAADDVSPLADDHRVARTGEIRGRHETVVSGADDDGVGRCVHQGMRPVMTRVSFSSPCVLLMSVYPAARSNLAMPLNSAATISMSSHPPGRNTSRPSSITRLTRPSPSLD